MKDYYKILGVNKTDSADTIKRAYRKLASQHHPDKGGSKEQFQEIQEAYATLGDPDKRSQYDNPSAFFGTNRDGSFRYGGQGFDFDSIFEMFGQRFGPNGQAHGRHNQRITIWLQLEDVATGGPRTISLATTQSVGAVEIIIPQGVQDGENIRYPGLAPGGGDLVVSFRIHPNRNWQRNGLDLYCQRGLDFWQLILGTNLRIKDIYGTELDITVPPRTKPGAMLRARGRGLKRAGHNTGDLNVQILATMPVDIPEELIEILEKQANK